jgi:hypothetical protein
VSRWPTDRAALRLARSRDVRTRVTRAWSRARGRLPSHVVYLRPQGVVSWPADGEAAGSGRFDDFAAWCAAHPGADARLHVSGHAIHNLVVDADLSAAGADAVRRYAQQQFTHYHGPQAARWPLAVWADGPSRGASALHGVDLPGLRAAAADHEVRLLGLAPAWSAGLASLSLRHPEFIEAGRHALLLVEGGIATWIVVEGGRIAALRQRWLDSPCVEAVVRVLGELLREGPALAGHPVVAGWDITEGAALPPELATSFGPLDGTGAMAEWMCRR